MTPEPENAFMVFWRNDNRWGNHIYCESSAERMHLEFRDEEVWEVTITPVRRLR